MADDLTHRLGPQYFMHSFEGLIKTPAGMHVPYKIEVSLKRYDDAQAIKAGIADDISQQRSSRYSIVFEKLEEFWRNWFTNGDWILALGFSPVAIMNGERPPYCITRVNSFRLTTVSETTEEPLPGGMWLRDGDVTREYAQAEPNGFWFAVREAITTQFDFAGCKGHNASFHEGEWTAELIEENAKVPLPKTIETLIEADKRYNMAVEFSSAKASKEILNNYRALGNKYRDLRDLCVEQKISVPRFTVSTVQLGDAIEISWELADNTNPKHLQGYRREGGFHSDPWDAAANGTLEIDARGKKGRTSQHLAPGTVHYYTLVIAPEWKKRFFGEPYRVMYLDSVARFIIRMPTADEARRTEEIIKAGMAPPPTEPARVMSVDEEVAERLRSIEEKLLKGHLTKEGVLRIMNKMRDEMKNKAGLTDDDKDYLEKYLSSEAERILRDSRL